MTLARSDGLLWLGISFLVALWKAISPSLMEGDSSPGNVSPFSFPSARKAAVYCFLVLAGFLVILSPWYTRNLSIFGGLMAPGGSHALWLTNYNDTFAYPASQLTMESWLASGWDSILGARLHALSLNLLNAFAAQGGIFLFPFILIGLWLLRKDFRIRLALLAWSLLLLVMTLVFPFAGARGAFFHSGAALQPIWWAIAPIGLEAVVAFVRRRGWFDDRAYVVFRASLVGIAILMTAVIFVTRVLPGWEREDGHYAAVENLLDELGVDDDAIVIVRNPPGYHIVTGRSAIAIPASGIPSILEVAARYQGRYLILEPEGTSEELRALYDDPDQIPAFNYLGETDGNRIFEIIQ
jgi:hypothetical protein